MRRQRLPAGLPAAERSEGVGEGLDVTTPTHYDGQAFVVPKKLGIGPYVRRGDDAWAEVVRWTQYAMLEAEALGITRDKASQFLRLRS